MEESTKITERHTGHIREKSGNIARHGQAVFQEKSVNFISYIGRNPVQLQVWLCFNYYLCFVLKVQRTVLKC